MTKKITTKKAKYILNTKVKFSDYFVNWRLQETFEENGGGFQLKKEYKLPIKVLFSIPCYFIIIFYSLWNGGLKEGLSNISGFWKTTPIHEHKNYYINSTYARMKKVFDNK